MSIVAVKGASDACLGTSLSLSASNPTFGCPPTHSHPPCPPSILDCSLFCKTVIPVCHVPAIKLHLGAPSLLRGKEVSLLLFYSPASGLISTEYKRFLLLILRKVLTEAHMASGAFEFPGPWLVEDTWVSSSSGSDTWLRALGQLWAALWAR